MLALILLIVVCAHAASQPVANIEATRQAVTSSDIFKQKVAQACAGQKPECADKATDLLFCKLVERAKPDLAAEHCGQQKALGFVQLPVAAPEDALAHDMTRDFA